MKGMEMLRNLMPDSTIQKLQFCPNFQIYSYNNKNIVLCFIVTYFLFKVLLGIVFDLQTCPIWHKFSYL